MIKLVVFDMAGTTVDEQNVVYRTVRAAINAAGYAVTQQQVQVSGAGKEKRQAIADVLAEDGDDHSEQEIQSIFADFRERLKTAYENLDVIEQPNASAVFSSLKQLGIHVVLNTGYDRTTAEGLLRKLNWTVGNQIDALVTADDVLNGRPAPDMIELAMQQTGISDSKQVAKIGDSKIDIEEGQNARCGMTFGITTGAQVKSDLQQANPTAVIEDLAELVPLITKNTSR